jgi:hypothetical protein
MKHYMHQKITKNVNGGTETITNHYAIPVKRTDPFYMVFEDRINSILDVESLIDSRLLHELACAMTFNTNEVFVPNKRRQELCNKLSINTSQFSKSIKRLKSVGLLSGDKGVFLLNPYVLWKGETQVRVELINKGDSKIRTQFIKETKTEAEGIEVTYNPFNGGSRDFLKDAA